MKAFLAIVLLGLLSVSPLAQAEPAPMTRINKLQQMFRFYYLPFSLDFREGRVNEEIFPFAPDKYREFTRLVKPDEIQKLDQEWQKIREEWKKKSLFLSTPIAVNESVRLTPKLVSHRIALTRTAWHGLGINERVKLEEILTSKPKEIQQAVTQLRHLKSFLLPTEEGKFNFFIVGPQWCESSREYRALFEAYFKNFPSSDLVLHAVLVEDLKEEIFDSKLMKDLFPNPEKYSHEIVPRFLAIQTIDGQTTIWEEGEALKELYDRFYKQHRGYMDSKMVSLKNLLQPFLKANVDPTVSIAAQ